MSLSDWNSALPRVCTLPFRPFCSLQPLDGTKKVTSPPYLSRKQLFRKVAARCVSKQCSPAASKQIRASSKSLICSARRSYQYPCRVDEHLLGFRRQIPRFSTISGSLFCVAISAHLCYFRSGFFEKKVLKSLVSVFSLHEEMSREARAFQANAKRSCPLLLSLYGAKDKTTEESGRHHCFVHCLFLFDSLGCLSGSDDGTS